MDDLPEYLDVTFRGFAFGTEREWRIFWQPPDPELGATITFRMLRDDGRTLKEETMRIVEVKRVLDIDDHVQVIVRVVPTNQTPITLVKR